ncbi:hypothetical protein V6N11_002166 [Hibiscus sabdariffa]|uniref:Uncharacterized protein n=1 Tax=Hibiscus sabdariffa TaxID=183260 RepID=A0ABR2QUL5_9ROSI
MLLLLPFFHNAFTLTGLVNTIFFLFNHLDGEKVVGYGDRGSQGDGTDLVDVETVEGFEDAFDLNLGCGGDGLESDFFDVGEGVEH